MNCENCIHYDVCKIHTEADRGCPPYRTKSYATECGNFKDKSKFIELPKKYARKFNEEYKNASRQKYIKFPLPYALYQTWKIANIDAEAKLKELESEQK